MTTVNRNIKNVFLPQICFDSGLWYVAWCAIERSFVAVCRRRVVLQSAFCVCTIGYDFRHFQIVSVPNM